MSKLSILIFALAHSPCALLDDLSYKCPLAVPLHELRLIFARTSLLASAMIRLVTTTDTPRLVAIATATGLFSQNEAEAFFGNLLDDLHARRLGDNHIALAWTDEASIGEAKADLVGWVYFSPEKDAETVWQLWFIGVDPRGQGQGIGSKLLQKVEDHVQEKGGRLLLIETSSLFDETQRFYSRRGYTRCGQIPDFYADGDDKVIYVKRFNASTSE